MNELEEILRNDLTRTYGPLLGSKQLIHALGFRTQSALSRSIREGHLTVHMFSLPGRTGRFATAVDVARWIATQREASTTQRVTLAPPSAESDGEEVRTIVEP